MARVVVDVMLKPEILDPQGRAVLEALQRLGLSGVASVRQGKRFEIELDAEVDEALAEQLEELAGSLLSNPVIEDYEIYQEIHEVPTCDCDGCECSDCECGTCVCQGCECGGCECSDCACAQCECTDCECGTPDADAPAGVGA